LRLTGTTGTSELASLSESLVTWTLATGLVTALDLDDDLAELAEPETIGDKGITESLDERDATGVLGVFELRDLDFFGGLELLELLDDLEFCDSCG